MIHVETDAKRRLLERDINAVDFLATEKQRLIREELYADAELVKDEMSNLRDEIEALRMEIAVIDPDDLSKDLGSMGPIDTEQAEVLA